MRDKKKIGVKDYIVFKTPARPACVVFLPRDCRSANVVSLIDSFNNYEPFFTDVWTQRGIHKNKDIYFYQHVLLIFNIKIHTLKKRAAFNWVVRICQTHFDFFGLPIPYPSFSLKQKQLGIIHEATQESNNVNIRYTKYCVDWMKLTQRIWLRRKKNKPAILNWEAYNAASREITTTYSNVSFHPPSPLACSHFAFWSIFPSYISFSLPPPPLLSLPLSLNELPSDYWGLWRSIRNMCGGLEAADGKSFVKLLTLIPPKEPEPVRKKNS